MSRDAFAEKCFVSVQAVWKWEHGVSLPSIETLVSLSRLFGVTLDELITEEIGLAEVS